MRERRALKLALAVGELRSGGAERAMANLANALAAHVPVDLVLATAEGPYLDEIRPEVRIVDLRAGRVLASLPGLVRYLRRERPQALLSAREHVNIVSLWARLLARSRTRVIVSVRNTLSVDSRHSTAIKARLMPRLARSFYTQAHGIVAVSHGVADDLFEMVGIPRDRITVIYNPMVTPDQEEKARAPVDHPWFRSQAAPVILGAGRLTRQKDFPTLIRAFARLERPETRLVILGEGPDRPSLEKLIRDLGLEARAALLGFVANPFAYMARARTFALSSAWEGLPGVLIQAMACGCPVVATDCQSGPREILLGGKLGPLVPVGDVDAMAAALGAAMDAPTPVSKLKARAADFSADLIARQYLAILLPDGCAQAG